MAHDVSKNIELESQEFALSAEQVDRISHDFRSPLNIIIGFTELLLDEVPGKINDEQRRSLNDIYQSSKRLLALVNDIIDSPSPGSDKTT